MCMRWRCRAAPVCGRHFHDGGRQSRPITSRNGTGAVGRRSVRGWTAHVSALAVSGSTCMRAAVSRRRAAARPMTSPNGTGAVGRRWVRGCGRSLQHGVSALAVSGSDLYAGGDFTTAGGSAANNIAQWNGSSWSALGSGMNGSVYALAVSGSTCMRAAVSRRRAAARPITSRNGTGAVGRRWVRG